jgi:hypothetical protein
VKLGLRRISKCRAYENRRSACGQELRPGRKENTRAKPSLHVPYFLFDAHFALPLDPEL